MEFIAREQREHVPTHFEGGFNATVFVFALVQKSRFKRFAELSEPIPTMSAARGRVR
jgi:hypothetical protein